VRWDRASSYAPVEGNGVARTSFLNASPITIEKTTGVDAYNDISPRIGLAYDVFGTGRTAVKLRWGKYLGFASNDSPYTSTNPAATLVATVTNRGWTDSNGNLAVDCDLLNPARQDAAATGGDVCVAAVGNSANFGKVGAATTVDPDVLSGWGKRTHDYQTEITLQQEVFPRVSAEVSYIHRTFHGFRVTNNINANPETDWTFYTIDAPLDPRLPDGGGYPILQTARLVNPPTQNLLTWEKNFGNGKERDSSYDGVNLNVNARMQNGFFISAGTSTGRSAEDRCHIVPNLANPNPRNCRDIDPWQTTVRGLASYTVPRVDVLVSAIMRSEPPRSLSANWRVPNSQIIDLLGFVPPGMNANGNTTIALHDNEHRIFADERRTQVDMRFAKVLRFGRTRTDVGVDLNNLFNTNYATGNESTFEPDAPGGGTWANPTSIYSPRFVRLNFTVNF
jgi:hypothetical protein